MWRLQIVVAFGLIGSLLFYVGDTSGDAPR